MTMRLLSTSLLMSAICAAAAPSPVWALSQAETDALVKEIDARQKNIGDYKGIAYLEQKENGKADLVYECQVYRRDAEDQLVLLFSKPKAEAGRGYLRLDQNLFFYDPSVGKWERRTERESIGGTGSRRSDFDESRLAEEYTAKWIADETLGKMEAHHLELKVKPGVEAAAPVLDIWVEKTTKNLLKRQEKALSGQLLRTSFFPQWSKIFSKAKNADFYFPKEMRIFDEVEKGKQTMVVLRDVSLEPLSANIFTKAWLEAKSR